ncbi:hypothetical protein E2C01_084043 [Portunus trituberculatus]|uniref:Uncharacterized protein n=1 Tax=Portunus trituberculatus TaxID=210409 RepID=A0A5B7IX35_PORTR|nr:hypothetical protein [Portunus trituberculatus]
MVLLSPFFFISDLFCFPGGIKSAHNKQSTRNIPSIRCNFTRFHKDLHKPSPPPTPPAEPSPTPTHITFIFRFTPESMLFRLLTFSLVAWLVVAAKTNHTEANHEEETNGYAEVHEDVTNESCTAGLPVDECTFRSQGKGPKEKIFISMIETYARIGFNISEKRPADMSLAYEVCCHGTVFYLVMKPKNGEETKPKPKKKKSKRRKFTPAERAKLRKALLRTKEKRRREKEENATSEEDT